MSMNKIAVVGAGTMGNGIAHVSAQSADGRLGVKSGEGFYLYTPGSKDSVVSPRFRQSSLNKGDAQ